MRRIIESETKDDLHNYYRLELANQVGYLASTLIACVGLFNMDLFLRLADTYKMSVPIVALIVSFLVAYFGAKTYNLLQAREGSGINITAPQSA